MGIGIRNKVLDQLMNTEDKVKGALVSAGNNLQTQAETIGNSIVEKSSESLATLKQTEATMRPQIERMVKETYPANVLPHVSATQISQLSSIMKTTLDSTSSMVQKNASDITSAVNKMVDSKVTPSIPGTISVDMTTVTKALQDTKQTVREMPVPVMLASLSQTMGIVAARSANISSTISTTTSNMSSNIPQISASISLEAGNITSGLTSAMASLNFKPPTSFITSLTASIAIAQANMASLASSAIGQAMSALSSLSSGLSGAAAEAVSDAQSLMGEGEYICDCVIGTDGNDYLCIKSNWAEIEYKPITGELWNLYWYPRETTGRGKQYESSYMDEGELKIENNSIIVRVLDNPDPEILYLLSETHTSDVSNKPGDGSTWMSYWIELPPSPNDYEFVLDWTEGREYKVYPF